MMPFKVKNAIARRLVPHLEIVACSKASNAMTTTTANREECRQAIVEQRRADEARNRADVEETRRDERGGWTDSGGHG